MTKKKFTKFIRCVKKAGFDVDFDFENDRKIVEGKKPQKNKIENRKIRKKICL